MKLYDITDLALRNLRESVFRNSLTTIGISVGVASLVAMLSLGIGLQQLAARRLQKSGLFDTVVVTSRRAGRNFGERRGGNPMETAESPVLDEAARQKIQLLPGVAEAYPDIRFATEVRFEDKPRLAMVAGLPYSARSNDSFDGMGGRFFSSDNAPEVILQKSFAEALLGKVPPPGADTANAVDLARTLVGKDIVMRYAERAPASPSADAADNSAYSVVSREQVLKIVGVSDLDPESMRAAARASVFLPLKLAESLHVMPSDLREPTFSDVPAYNSVSVRVKDPNQVLAVEDAVKKMGFGAFSILDATKGMQQFFAVLDVFLGIFGSLALAVASIGIVNTLVMAILERRREIGIMKALGASDGDVRGLFFAEAAAMGLVGGSVGVALGWAIGRIINFGTNIYLQRQQFPPAQIWSVPLWLVFGAIGFSLVVSLLSGLYPAGRAARLDPVQALRYE
jgi:putative ABC transport system permease protein